MMRPMQFQDRAFIDGPARITREGHLVATARVAKANNIQDYMPGEIGQPPKADGSPYRIFRPESAVFAKDAIASAAHRPITIDHPAEDVNATNWKSLAVGDTGGEVMRDGDFLRIPVMVMDSRGVEAAQKTHREFSLGYSADLSMVPGKFGDAEYDGSMTNIRVNHLALCGSARGGSELRIIDERPAPKETPMKIKIGDAEVDATNGEAVSIAVGHVMKRMGDAETALATAQTQIADSKKLLDTKDGEIAALKTQLADAVVTPAKLNEMIASRAKVIDAAKAMGVEPDGDETEADIKKKAVTKKMGDAAKDMSDAAIDGAFAVLAKDGATHRHTAPSGQPMQFGDARAAATQARAQWLADKENAHTGQAA